MHETEIVHNHCVTFHSYPNVSDEGNIKNTFILNTKLYHKCQLKKTLGSFKSLSLS